jgi:hypothetical protein
VAREHQRQGDDLHGGDEPLDQATLLFLRHAVQVAMAAMS